MFEIGPLAVSWGGLCWNLLLCVQHLALLIPGGVMEITRKTDYALRMVEALVKHPNEIVSVKDISDENFIPYTFARAIQRDLVKAGIVRSARGAHGGIVLVVPPEKITLYDLIEAIQGHIRINECLLEVDFEGNSCPRLNFCPYFPVWKNAQELFESYFKSMTVADIMNRTYTVVEDGCFKKESINVNPIDL